MIEQDIQARMEALKANLKSLHDTYCATQGAIAECEFWLKSLKKPKPSDV